MATSEKLLGSLAVGDCFRTSTGYGVVIAQLDRNQKTVVQVPGVRDEQVVEGASLVTPVSQSEFESAESRLRSDTTSARLRRLKDAYRASIAVRGS
jgi:hypothetical protein